MDMTGDNPLHLAVPPDHVPERLSARRRQPRLCQLLPNSTCEVLAVPRDCTDRFLAALWARPHELLDPATRAATSPWYDLPAETVDNALTRLQDDLHDGTWGQRYGYLLDRAELDVGFA
jgi:hypothetical protein